MHTRAPVSGGFLCFVDADRPIFGGNFTIDGVEVLWAERLLGIAAADVAGPWAGIPTSREQPTHNAGRQVGRNILDDPVNLLPYRSDLDA